MRDREATENTIIHAINQLIQKSGFSSLGVNAIAREAGVSKVLIYRYFGNFEGLLEEWALRNSYWIEIPIEMPENINLKKAASATLKGQIESLTDNKVKREVLRWLLAEETEVGKKVMHRLEERGVARTQSFLEKIDVPGDLDVEALIALITAGISYLALLSDRADVYNGVSLCDDEGWMRIQHVIDYLLGIIFTTE